MEEGEQAHGPQLLPGGEWLLFTLRSGPGSWNDASIVAQPVSGGEPKVLVSGGTDGRYVPTGHIVYSLEGNLLAVPFDMWITSRLPEDQYPSSTGSDKRPA